MWIWMCIDFEDECENKFALNLKMNMKLNVHWIWNLMWNSMCTEFEAEGETKYALKLIINLHWIWK